MREGHGKYLSYYDRGRTPFFALRTDQRFCYCLYVPEQYEEEGAERYDLIVPVHGTERGAWEYRDEFAAFAESHACIVLAPLFPCNIGTDDDLDNYKLINYAGIRFDRVLLDMVMEVARKYRLRGERFLLHGFSGGGHFAHRFFYLHPRRLLGVSIGAPGLVTLLDESLPWWIGARDLQQRFGIALDYEAMRHVPVQMVIGGEDKATWEITITEDSPWWMAGANDAGVNRLDRMQSLKQSFERNGIAVRHDIVAGVQHDGSRVLEPVKQFMRDILIASRKDN